MDALLHDMGKIVYRTDGKRVKHSISGAKFLEPFFHNEDNKNSILRAIEHHHADEMRNFEAPKDDISYIVYEADNIASAADRRSNEGDNEKGFDMHKPLESVFNTLQVVGACDSFRDKQRLFKLQGLLEGDNIQYPTLQTGLVATFGEYSNLLNILEQHLKNKPIDTFAINEMLQLWEAIASYIPSSTDNSQIADISLYDHQKLTKYAVKPLALAQCH